MTLTKTKPRRPTAEHRKRNGLHHHRNHNYVKTYWPYLPMVTILLFGLVCSGWIGRTGQNVLGYATDMSVPSLLDDTNHQRTNSNEPTLNLNDQLNQAAQAKANDMAARNYWSHNTPDGNTPWTFMTAAGYNYQTAGENLAYGFDTAADTVTGWMNSPEHRANILNTSYHDVGFGIVNIPDYQSTGPETLVVAMYGSLAGETAVNSAPVPTAPVQKPSAPPVAPSPTPQPTPAPTSTPITTTTPAVVQPAPVHVQKDTLEPQQRITQLQLVSNNTPLNTLAITIFAMSAATLLVIRHSWVWRKVLANGEKFVLRHPLLDIAAATIVSATIALSHTAGIIR